MELRDPAERLQAQRNQPFLENKGWEQLVNAIFCTQNSTKKPAASSCFEGTLYLRPEIYKQLWDEQGKFIKHNKYGRRDVGYAYADGRKIWFKRFPGIAGLEKAINCLMHYILGCDRSFIELAVIDGEVFLMSLDVAGINLQAILDIQEKGNRNHNPEQLNNLDLEATLKLIILAMLINPEDLKADNIICQLLPLRSRWSMKMIESEGAFVPDVRVSINQEYCLHIIDTENSFVPAVSQPCKDGFLKQGVKCLLFCLDQMKVPIPLNVREFFLKLKPMELLTQWLRELSHIHTSHLALFSEREKEELWKEHECFIGIPFAKNMMSRFYGKFMRLQHVLEKNKDNSGFTALDLLRKLEPVLAQRYEPVLNSAMTVSQRFLQVDGPFFERSASNNLVSTASVSSILKSQTVPLGETALDAVKNRSEIGPALGLFELQTIQEQSTLNLLGAGVASICSFTV